MKKVLSIIEFITGISGFGLLWWQTNFWITLAVFLLVTSHQTKLEINLMRQVHMSNDF